MIEWCGTSVVTEGTNPGLNPTRWEVSSHVQTGEAAIITQTYLGDSWGIFPHTLIPSSTIFPWLSSPFLRLLSSFGFLCDAASSSVMIHGGCVCPHSPPNYVLALFTMESAVTDAGAVIVRDDRLANRFAVYSAHSPALRCGHFTSALQHWTTVLDLLMFLRSLPVPVFEIG